VTQACCSGLLTIVRFDLQQSEVGQEEHRTESVVSLSGIDMNSSKTTVTNIVLFDLKYTQTNAISLHTTVYTDYK